MSRRAAYLVLLAFAVRIAFMLGCDTYRFAGADDYDQFGEASSIARSIATGHGFASPFNAEYTGPTAWIAPVYPYLIAGLFKTFGVFSVGAALALFTLQSLFSALTVLPILGIARRTVGLRSGFLAAATWAVFPWFSKWAVTWMWEVSLSALLFTAILWYALELDLSSTWRWIGFGALCGFALNVNPALLAAPIVAGLWLLYRRVSIYDLGLAAVVAALLLTPWMIRNHEVFDRWVFLRGNFGFEFALGNYHDSFGRGWGGFHPTGSPREYNDYKRLGEPAYVAMKQREGLAFVRAYPLEFAELTARRISYFWDGSALGYRDPIASRWLPGSFGVFSFLLLFGLLAWKRTNAYGWQLVFGSLALYPLPYYLTYAQARYRHAVEPLMLLLVAYAVVRAYDVLVLRYRH